MSTPIFSSADRVNAVIKIRRGPDSDRINSIYDSGELIYTTDKKRVYIGDGINAAGTYGGNIVGNKAWVTDNFAKLNNIEIGDSVYRTDTSSYYVLTGSAYLLESSYVLVGGNEIIKQNISNGTVPKATKSTLGVIKAGANLDIAADGTLNLPKATSTILGGVKVGTGLSADTDGKLSVTGGGNGGSSTYTLSAATTTKLGGVIVGSGLSADNTGTLSLSAIPKTANLGQILTWNGTKWIASDPSTLGVGGDAIPIGTVMYFAASANIPVGYIECDGRVVDRSYYADLDSVIYCGNANNSTALFGYRCTLSADPVNTRNTNGKFLVLPDLRGEFVRGWDHVTSDGRAIKIDTNRKFGSYQTDAMQPITGSILTQSSNAEATGAFELGTLGTNTDGGFTGSGNPTDVIKFDSSNVTRTAVETRPRNVALVACIKALKNGKPSVINYIPKPVTADDGQVLTYQRSSNSWVAGSSNEKVYYNLNDVFIISDRPDEDSLTGSINNSYANKQWTNIKTITNQPWDTYFGTRNPKTITLLIYTNEEQVKSTVGKSITLIDNKKTEIETIDGKNYLWQTLNSSGNNSELITTSKIWLNEDGTAYLKISPTDPKTHRCRMYLIEAEF